ncbi:MAG: hypothetical protein RIT04_675 [Candidatus Parcubacteria bacterium]|jgi:hypothetical protein
MVARFAESCGFSSMAHIKGEPSIFSIKMGIEGGVACLCGAATISLLNAALEKVFLFGEPYDVISYGYDNIEFPTPNIAGGSVEFTFTVLSTKSAAFPLKRIKKSLPMSNISFVCHGTNTLTGKKVIQLIWHLGYIATSEINNIT